MLLLFKNHLEGIKIKNKHNSLTWEHHQSCAEGGGAAPAGREGSTAQGGPPGAAQQAPHEVSQN